MSGNITDTGNCRPIAISYLIFMACRGGSRGGARGPPLSENLGIDFYSGFRIFFHVYTFIVASEKKTQGGGVQFEILRNPGIDFYSGFKKKIQV